MYLFENVLSRIRVPWTENIYNGIEKHGFALWEKYGKTMYKTKQEKQEHCEEENVFTEKKVPKKKKIQKKSEKKPKKKPAK